MKKNIFILFALAVVLFLFPARVAPNPFLPILAGNAGAADVVLQPPTNTLYWWFAADLSPNVDGEIMGNGAPGGAGVLTNISTLNSRNLGAFVNGNRPPLYSNAVVNAKAAIVWPTNTPTALWTGDPGANTTISGWTLVILYWISPNATEFNTERIWEFSNDNRGLYYNILSSGSGNAQYWGFANNTAQITLNSSPSQWELVSCRFQYSAGVLELRNNTATATSPTGTSANETVRWAAVTGTMTNRCAEILFYTNRLSDADLILARRYMTNKYAIVATP